MNECCMNSPKVSGLYAKLFANNVLITKATFCLVSDIIFGKMFEFICLTMFELNTNIDTCVEID